jgi:hypothetical protein
LNKEKTVRDLTRQILWAMDDPSAWRWTGYRLIHKASKMHLWMANGWVNVSIAVDDTRGIDGYKLPARDRRAIYKAGKVLIEAILERAVAPQESSVTVRISHSPKSHVPDITANGVSSCCP